MSYDPLRLSPSSAICEIPQTARANIYKDTSLAPPKPPPPNTTHTISQTHTNSQTHKLTNTQTHKHTNSQTRKTHRHTNTPTQSAPTLYNTHCIELGLVPLYPPHNIQHLFMIIILCYESTLRENSLRITLFMKQKKIEYS